VVVQETYVTERGRERRRSVRIDLGAVRHNLGLPSPEDRDDWQSIRTLLRETVGESTFEIWLDPLELIAIGNSGALLVAGPAETLTWVRERYGQLLAGSAQRVGRVLRRFSLDEVPNLINVLRGEMSLVGPRPLPVRDYLRLEAWHRRRSNVLPGMTGLWQIAGRSDLSFDDLVRLDFYYLENWSLWLDITILVKTLPAVIGRRGAY